MQKKIDVFLSWTGPDRELKNQLREFIESHGYKCYDSDRDCKGDYQLDFALREDESSVYLLILSPALFRSPYRKSGERYSVVKKELRYAGELEAVGQLNFVILSLVDLGGEPTEDENETFFRAHTASFNMIRRNQFEEITMAFEACLKQIKEFVEARKSGKPKPSCQPVLPVARHRLTLTSDIFIGREREMKQIQTEFKDNRVLILSGMGGIGKTELAKQFALNSPYTFTQVVTWKEDTPAAFNQLLTSVRYSGSVETEFNRTRAYDEAGAVKVYENALSDLDENCLLIIDNVNDINPAFVRAVYEKLNCRVIITTRSGAEFNIPEVKKVDITSLQYDELVQIFTNVYGQFNDEEKEIYRKKIYSPFLGNTQAIIMVAKMLTEQGISLEDYSESEDEYLKNNLYSQEIHGEEAFDTVANNLCRFFKINKFLENPCVERSILAVMTYVQQTGIPEKYFKEKYGLKNANEFISLSKMGLINRLNTGDFKFMLTMHPMIARALELNGIKPENEDIKELTKYYSKYLTEIIESEKVTVERLNATRETLKKLTLSGVFKGKEEKPNSKKQSSDENEEKDLIDVLLDEDNRDPIPLIDDLGRKVLFEQVAVIPYEIDGEEILYCILKPIDKIENVADDEAIVFYVSIEDGGKSVLHAETNVETATKIFTEYYKLVLENVTDEDDE